MLQTQEAFRLVVFSYFRLGASQSHLASCVCLQSGIGLENKFDSLLDSLFLTREKPGDLKLPLAFFSLRLTLLLRVLWRPEAQHK
jgi:hypothetical protein